MKIRSVGAELFSMRTDGQTDTMKIILSFRNFATVPKRDLHVAEIPLSLGDKILRRQALILQCFIYWHKVFWPVIFIVLHVSVI
jgi:hypothetical protein